ncbi:hypothetical protein D3C79_1028350 [compost metagenome]
MHRVIIAPTSSFHSSYKEITIIKASTSLPLLSEETVLHVLEKIIAMLIFMRLEAHGF